MVYLVEDMVNIGLGDRNCPSKGHKQIAISIIIGNPNIENADKMSQVVDSILKVPADRLSTVTYKELIKEFGMPDVGLPA